MTPEAKLESAPNGLQPEDDGWFVVNIADAAWWSSPKFGEFCVFEKRGGTRFPHLGLNVHVLEPGQPACMYHRESMQEDFLVLSGECIALVEGQERPMKAWDLLHCPPGTDHVFVGAGTGPCVLLMVGARGPDVAVTYPVHALALRHGAGVATETSDPKVAYAGVAMPVPAEKPSWPPRVDGP